MVMAWKCIVIGVYRSPQVSIQHLYTALNNILTEHCADNTIILGDFNVNWFVKEQIQPLNNILENNGYQ